MSKIAFVFPGQGAQAVGMGKDVYEALPQSRAVFEKGDEVLGFPLSTLVFEGPDSELKQTVNTQPALVTASVAYLEALSGLQIAPDYVAGHSLGEYSALVAAGVLSYEDAVRLVACADNSWKKQYPEDRGPWQQCLEQVATRLRNYAAVLQRRVLRLNWPMSIVLDRLWSPVPWPVSVRWSSV